MNAMAQGRKGRSGGGDGGVGMTWVVRGNDVMVMGMTEAVGWR